MAPPVGHPVAERAAALVRDLAGGHREALDDVVAGLERVEAPVAPQLGRPDREVRRRQDPRQHLDRGRPAPACGGRRAPRDRSPARKKGSPWVWSQCRWPSRIEPRKGWPSSTPGQPLQAGARVEHQRRRPAVVGEGDARGVAAVAHELGPGRRASTLAPRRCTRAPGVSTTASRSRPVLLAPVALAHLGQRVGVELVGAGHRDLAPGDRPQRGRAQPALEDGPLAEDGARARARPDARRRPRRAARRRGGGRARRPPRPAR